MKHCVNCGSDIDADRVEYLEETGKPMVCKGCSTEQPKVCFVDYAHKTAGTLVVVGTNSESIRLATRAYRRAR